jgi:pimeloyl-ACP methyl ester carboxylesterase
MRRIERSVTLLASACLLLGCASQPRVPSSSPGATEPTLAPSTGASPTLAGPPGRELAGQPLTPCVVHGDVPVTAQVAGLCGTLRVPEDRSSPSGRQVDLHVAVIPALAAVPRPDPFVAIAGGPGDASSAFFAWLPGLYAGVHATHDIVLVDQRGTGGSNALTLPPLPDTSGLSEAEADTRLSAWMSGQLAALDADPRFYTSTVAADDLDDVRAALGYDTMDLYGTSYGGELAQYELRQHPDHVRVAVLDGSTPLDVPVLELMAANSQHALDLLLERCSEDPACHAAFPGLAAEWSTLAAQLATGITTDVVNPETGEHAVATLAIVGPGIHNALLTGATAAQLPLAIHLAVQGRWDLASRLVPAPAGGGPTLLMADEIFCSEAWARFDPTEVARVGAGSYALPMELARARERETLCRFLPKGVVPVGDAAPASTTIPVLWLTGDGDPQDPPANLAGVPSLEPDSLIAVMPAQEHVVGHLGCGPAVIAAFVDAGTATGLDTSCLAQGAAPSPAFELP